MSENKEKVEKQERLNNFITVTVPLRWNIQSDVLVITDREYEYYFLRFLAMSQLYDKIDVEWRDRYSQAAKEVIRVFQNSGWLETHADRVARLLKDRETGESRQVTINSSTMEKKG